MATTTKPATARRRSAAPLVAGWLLSLWFAALAFWAGILFVPDPGCEGGLGWLWIMAASMLLLTGASVGFAVSGLVRDRRRWPLWLVPLLLALAGLGFSVLLLCVYVFGTFGCQK